MVFEFQFMIKCSGWQNGLHNREMKQLSVSERLPHKVGGVLWLISVFQEPVVRFNLDTMLELVRNSLRWAQQLAVEHLTQIKQKLVDVTSWNASYQRLLGLLGAPNSSLTRDGDHHITLWCDLACLMRAELRLGWHLDWNPANLVTPTFMHAQHPIEGKKWFKRLTIMSH